jgi:hypothetical protein
MTGSDLKPDVPAGKATVAGYTTTIVAFVAMVLAFIFPEGDEQTLGTIAAGIVGLASLLWTSHIRGKQAVEQIRGQALIETTRVVNDDAPAVDTAGLRALLAATGPRREGPDA